MDQHARIDADTKGGFDIARRFMPISRSTVIHDEPRRSP